MPSVLFICTANQCRSPMAEVIGRQLLTDHHPAVDWQIGSAGVRAVNGYPATRAFALLAERHGLDLSRHSSQFLTQEMVATTDLLVTMEAAHKQTILHKFPAADERVFTLGELIGREEDVEDPIGMPLPTYEYTYGLLEEWIKAALPKIVRLTGVDQDTTA